MYDIYKLVETPKYWCHWPCYFLEIRNSILRKLKNSNRFKGHTLELLTNNFDPFGLNGVELSWTYMFGKCTQPFSFSNIEKKNNKWKQKRIRFVVDNIIFSLLLKSTNIFHFIFSCKWMSIASITNYEYNTRILVQARSTTIHSSHEVLRLKTH